MDTLKPPDGYDSWLDYAVEQCNLFPMRTAWATSHADTSSRIPDFEGALRAELAALRTKAATLDRLEAKLRTESEASWEGTLVYALLAEFFPEKRDVP